MSSYVVTGASRGIGLEFVRQLAAVPENKVFALVRNKGSAVHLTPLEGGNVYVLEADVTDHQALKAAASKVAEVTGGVLDVLINNAAAINTENDWRTLTDFEGEEDLLEQEFHHAYQVNVIGVIHSTNSFLPLLRKGTTKKVITIGTGGADGGFVLKVGLVGMSAYGASKAAAHLVVAKYAAQFKDEGVIFVALSPGLVDTSATAVKTSSANNAAFLEKTIEDLKKAGGMRSPEQSVAKQLKVIAEVSANESGAFLRLP